jgi:protein-disulfide isomerase
VLGVAAALLVAVAAAIGIAIAVGGGSGSGPAGLPAVGQLQGGVPGAADVQRLFHGIPQRGTVLGASAAPATMIEYVDLQCPYCREFDTIVLPKLIQRYVRAGKLSIDLRMLAFIGPDSAAGRSAALAAAEQGRLFNFAELAYFNQGTENTGWLDQALIGSTAASIPGLRVQKLLADAGSSRVSRRAVSLDSEALAAGVNSTPTVLVGKAGSRPVPVPLASPTDTASAEAAIDAALS